MPTTEILHTIGLFSVLEIRTTNGKEVTSVFQPPVIPAIASKRSAHDDAVVEALHSLVKAQTAEMDKQYGCQDFLDNPGIQRVLELGITISFVEKKEDGILIRLEGFPKEKVYVLHKDRVTLLLNSKNDTWGDPIEDFHPLFAEYREQWRDNQESWIPSDWKAALLAAGYVKEVTVTKIAFE